MKIWFITFFQWQGIKTIERVVIDEEKVKKDKKDIEVKCGEEKKYKLFAEG